MRYNNVSLWQTISVSDQTEGREVEDINMIMRGEGKEIKQESSQRKRRQVGEAGVNWVVHTVS